MAEGVGSARVHTTDHETARSAYKQSCPALTLVAVRKHLPSTPPAGRVAGSLCGMLTEGVSLFKRATMMMLYTRKALGLEQSPTKDEVLWWRPLMERMETLAKHRRLEQSGIAALRSFTDVWDERVRQLAAGEDRPAFSPAQIKAMTQSLADYEPWLRTHFPNAFIPHDPSSN